jgi:hypothetical protein
MFTKTLNAFAISQNPRNLPIDFGADALGIGRIERCDNVDFDAAQVRRKAHSDDQVRAGLDDCEVFRLRPPNPKLGIPDPVDVDGVIERDPLTGAERAHGSSLGYRQSAGVKVGASSRGGM